MSWSQVNESADEGITLDSQGLETFVEDYGLVDIANACGIGSYDTADKSGEEEEGAQARKGKKKGHNKWDKEAFGCMINSTLEVIKDLIIINYPS